MQGFHGFPDGKLKPLAVPALFFSELLPAIDDLNELKVTMYCFWALHQQEDEHRYVRLGEVLADTRFLQGLKNGFQSHEQALQEAFERAVARGTLLRVTIAIEEQQEAIYFINTEKGRRSIAALESGEWTLGDNLRPIELTIERPNIFVLYEQNIGPITPMIAEQLKDAEKSFSREWIYEAFQIAVTNNARNLRYILRILEQWSTKGKQVYGVARKPSEKASFTHLTEDYSDIIES